MHDLHAQVSLTASGSTGSSMTVVLKRASPGTVGGTDMVQTIFSDYAPSGFPNDAVRHSNAKQQTRMTSHSMMRQCWHTGCACPCHGCHQSHQSHTFTYLHHHYELMHTIVTQAAAPYSSAYTPAEPLAALVAGTTTSAGDGGSRGVWTLSVVDRATGTDLSRCANPGTQPLEHARRGCAAVLSQNNTKVASALKLCCSSCCCCISRVQTPPQADGMGAVALWREQWSTLCSCGGC